MFIAFGLLTYVPHNVLRISSACLFSAKLPAAPRKYNRPTHSKRVSSRSQSWVLWFKLILQFIDCGVLYCEETAPEAVSVGMVVYRYITQ